MTPSTIAEFLNWLRPGGEVAVTTILPDDQSTPTRVFTDYAEAERWALEQNAAGRNVYFTPNVVTPAVKKKGKKPAKVDIARVEFLFADLDPRAGEDRDAERHRIRHLLNGNLSKKGYPATSVIVDSGNGYNCLWRVAEPIEVNGDPDKIALVEGYTREIVNRLGGDRGTHNIDRILRMPFTKNWPNKTKRERGRTPTDAKVYDCPADVPYPLSAFPALAADSALAKPTTSRKAPSATQKRGQVPAGPYGVDELQAWATANGKQVPDTALAALVHGRDADPDKYPSRSEAAWAVCCGLARAGVPDELIVAALLDKNNPGGAHIRDAQNSSGYAWTQVAKARAEVEAEQLVRVDGSDYVPKWDRTTKDGNPLNSFNNTVEALRGFGLEFTFDEFRKQRVIGGHYLQDFAGPLSDNAEVFLRSLVRKHFGFDTGKDNVHDAIAELCLHNRFDSLLAHIEALPAWDGTARLDSWLVDYFGAEDSVYAREVGAVVLLAAIVRAFEPGAKFDYMLVLIGEQGIRKSSAVRVLAGGDALFSDAPLLAAKDAKEILELTAGVWIQECAELDGISRKDTETLKAMIVRTHDKARAAYGRTTQEVPRRFVMIGTTNERRFLRDATGNRRFWPMEVQRIDSDGLAAVRDQLLAEAFARYRSGTARLWLGDEAEAIARRLQGEHLAVDGSYRELLEFLEPEGVRDGTPFVATETVYTRLGIEAGMRSGAVAHRVAAVMASLGWRSYPHPITHGGKKQRIYVRPVAEDVPPTLQDDEKPPF
ncbi:hypothetical protein EA658_14445 [Pseudoxanthomonas winnipegensis]|uniref:Virulence-associated protein E-like domain-containing protein n=1 Tax=Pseudoxanthomonas winnipegensis TaxID=2480810 RepID=A0ABY1WBC8_9GAMM|nr:virulence-associated E family protein [Pseudoxanthomonas winnipegensis]TAA10893.1 hypothetical protein EA659_05855 [Pseudoxanthomonas winnipegensis]TAA18319.1 hypothetical protein EA658_14445 [Pseudoxanthomonas winnipegensis]TAH74306.1 hypothetical protein EA657_02305 [Pseudoxanthomonas winnipegensis]